jgi:hypothetical protein
LGHLNELSGGGFGSNLIALSASLYFWSVYKVSACARFLCKSLISERKSMGYQRISFFLKPVGSEPVLFWGYFVEGSGAHLAVLATAQAEVWKGE